MKATRNPKFEKVNGCTFAKIFLDSFAAKYGVGLDKLLEQVGKEELTNETINRINQE